MIRHWKQRLLAAGNTLSCDCEGLINLLFGFDPGHPRWCSGPVPGTGTAINVAAIIVGGLLGRIIAKDLSVARQQLLRKWIGFLIVIAGFVMVWEGLREVGLGARFGLIGIALLSTSLGRPIGKLMHVQAGMNRLGRYAGGLFTRVQQDESQRTFNDGFLACAILFCVSPLSVLGPVQDGMTGNFLTLAVKALMDGFAAFAFARTFGISVMFAALPVLAIQGTITLLSIWLLQQFPHPAMLPAINVVGGMLVICTTLIVFEVKKVELGDFLPALVVAALLAWWWM